MQKFSRSERRGATSLRRFFVATAARNENKNAAPKHCVQFYGFPFMFILKLLLQFEYSQFQFLPAVLPIVSLHEP